MTSWLSARLGRMRVSTIVLIVAFLALFWVYHNFEPPTRRAGGAADRGRPARLRARPELHLGAADQRATQGTRDHHHDHHADNHQPDVADGVHADDNGGSRAAGTADHHGDAYAHADDAAGARVGTSADHVGSAEIALSGFRPRHRYIGVP